MKDKDMLGRSRYKHGRKRGKVFTCGESVKIILFAVVLGLILLMVMNLITPIYGG